MKLIRNLRNNFEQHKTFIKFPDSDQVTKHDFQIVEHKHLSKSLSEFEETIIKLEQEAQVYSIKEVTKKRPQILLLNISKSVENLELSMQKMRNCFD